MQRLMKEALLEYGTRIRKDGWKAGEQVIRKYEDRFQDFRKWAYVLGIMLKAGKLLNKKY